MATPSKSRDIVTKFYFRRNILKVNRAIDPNAAVLHCVNHMQHNRYAASIAEIVDESNGELHAVVTRNLTGKITIVFKREVKDN